MKAWQIIALVVVVLLLAGGGTVAVVATKRGKKMTNAPAGPDGIVHQDPRKLADQAGVNIDVYALARMISSEHPNDAEQVKIAVAHATHNMAKKQGKSVSQLLLRGSKIDPTDPKKKRRIPSASDGLFGRQNTGKYATTANDPTAADLEIANGVLSGRIPDNTMGSIQFDVPRAQRAGLAKKLPGYKKTPEQVAAERKAAGLVMFTLPGIDAEQFRMWRLA